MNGLDLLLLVWCAILTLHIVMVRSRLGRIERGLLAFLNVRAGRIMQAHPKDAPVFTPPYEGREP